MMSRSVRCALLVACALGCTNDSTPTSMEKPAELSPALADGNAQVHTIVVLTRESDYTRDGTIDETYVVRTSYDRNGNALLVEEESNRAGSIRRKVTRSSYDRWGNMLEQVIDRDPENGPSNSQYWITTVATDRLGRPTRQVYLLDYDLDGMPDHEGSTLLYPAYDPRGRPLQEIMDSDNDGDGAIETRRTQTMAYDPHGNVERRTSESDWQMDGSIEESHWEESTHNRYGAVVKAVSESFATRNGISTTSTTTSEFDGRGNPITQLTVTDYPPADGTADARQLLTTSFDDRHRPQSQVTEIDIGADGTFEARITYTYEYFGTLTIPSASAIPEMSSAGSRETHGPAAMIGMTAPYQSAKLARNK